GQTRLKDRAWIGQDSSRSRTTQRSPLARGRIHLRNCHRRHVREPCTDGADHTFFAAISLSIALSSSASANSFFGLAFSSSSDFNRLASDTSRPPYLAFHL